MVNSIHVARWLQQFDARQYRFILVPSTPSRSIHPSIRGLQNDFGHIKVLQWDGRLSRLLWAMDIFFANKVRGALMKLAIKKHKPDLVHALEFQSGAYLAVEGLQNLDIGLPFIATSYGSDIFWFQRFPRHVSKIKRVLDRADAFSAECKRDVNLARTYGFTGLVLPVIPNAGGFDKPLLPPSLPLKDRKIILLKGYDSWVGRGSMAVRAIGLLETELEDLEVVVYSAERKTVNAIKSLPSKLAKKFTIYKKGELTHLQMLTLFGKARLYIGISESDGISTSLLESLSMGCFPVQTSTACTDEWFIDGFNGISVKTINEHSVAEAIKEALRITSTVPGRDFQIERAAILEKLDATRIANIAKTFYPLTLKSAKLGSRNTL